MQNKVAARLLDPDQPGSLTYRCRLQRKNEFARQFPNLTDMCVLDLGGTAISWRVLGLRPKHVTVVNLGHAEAPEESWLEVLNADACTGGFGKYDLVYSNSLMEHLGGHFRRQRFADVVQASAPFWWIQTPYRYFPIEPHWIFPFFQFFPFSLQVALSQRVRMLHDDVSSNPAEAAERVASIELISATQMRTYFPNSAIWFERFAGLPKSLTAIQSGDSVTDYAGA